MNWELLKWEQINRRQKDVKQIIDYEAALL